MKKIQFLFAALLAVVVLAGCTSLSTNTNSATTNTNSPNSLAQPWIGEWRMVSETASTTAGDIENPATNKIIEFNDNNSFTEDYSSLEGLGVCNETRGEYESTWSVDGDVISVDVPGSTELEAPYIDCGANAGTSAVPRSIASFSYSGDSWKILYDEATDRLTAEIVGPPGTVIQVFERN